MARNGKWVNVDSSEDRTNMRGELGASNSLFASQNVSQDGASGQLHVTVNEPSKQGEGMNAYISYKISTTTDRPQFARSSFSVIRRYNDFVWLHSCLQSRFPGVVVPPLPEKLLVGRFSPEFIESRRRALQLFLQRCGHHPELQHSDHLTTFLEASDEAFQSFRSDPQNGTTPSGALFQWLDETVSSISSTLGAAAFTSSGGNLEKTQADKDVEEVMAYIDGLEPIMSGLHRHASGLSKRAREIADGLFEMGVACSMLAKAEDTNASLHLALSTVGDCSDRLATLAAEHAEKEALQFEEPIVDYIRVVGAVKAALHKRNEVRAAYAAAVADLEAKTQAVGKNGGQGAVHKNEEDAMQAQQRVDDAKLEFDVVTERVLREVERFQRQKLSDFKRIILDYIQMQIQYSKQVESEWEKVMPELAEINSGLGQISEKVDNTLMIQEDYVPSNGNADMAM